MAVQDLPLSDNTTFLDGLKATLDSHLMVGWRCQGDLGMGYCGDLYNPRWAGAYRNSEITQNDVGPVRCWRTPGHSSMNGGLAKDCVLT
jgi:hypothetical protein